jgi:hypothetical protein
MAKTPKYPTTPAAMPAEVEAQFAQMFGNARSNVEQAVRQGEYGRKRTFADFAQNLRRQESGYAQQRQQAGGQLGALGLGTSPAFMGRALSEIRNKQASGFVDLQSAKQDRLSALQQMVTEAQSRFEQTQSDIARERARYGADVSRLVRGAR